MKLRAALLVFILVEAALLLAAVAPVAHARSLTERLLLPDSRAPLAPNEGLYIGLRSLLMVLALQAAFAFRDLYRWNVILRPQLVVVRLVEAMLAVLIAVPALHYGLVLLDRHFELNGLLSRLQIHPLLVMACAGVAFLAAYVLRLRGARWVRHLGFSERVLVVGHGPLVDVVEEELRRRRNPAIELVGFLDESWAHRTVLGTPADVLAVAREQRVDRVVLEASASVPAEALLALREAGVQATDLPSLYEQLTGRLAVESLLGPELFLSLRQGPSLLARPVQRLIDIAVALLGLALAGPLCLLAALLIKLDSRGPVLYRQERVGLNGRPFMLSKFRSMRSDAESASGPVWASAADARVTRVGRWLRKLRIDEIPQLWSVVRNDMSLVGPRPERPFFVAELEREVPHYAQRHLVKPGVTGWAQINHSYGNTVDDAFIKLQYDLYYVKHRSLALDVAILLRTVKVVALQQGAV